MLEPNKPSFNFSSPPPPPPPAPPQQHISEVAASRLDAGGDAPYNPPQFDPNSNQVLPPQQQRDERVYRGVHPFAALFHVLFKLGAILMFILGTLVSSYVTVFVITILFLAADFWTTKNVSGRLLVSLRWWNEVREDGTTQWVFESAPDAEIRVNSFDKWFFWVTTGGNCVVWALMVLFNLMSFARLPMAVIGVVLSGANFVGFLKCSRDAKKKITNYMLAQAAQQPDLVRKVAGAL
ncbi:protein FAM18B1 [Trypanosoma grayi]|uniref:protein FAM18B1 n=1 Tax=Trypanosoma grayi TaxID=71804 RepID=UPI0004F47E18|nr:protein FAM18B1 [Trypanosoma grayi]KEG14236.1 protein FAM18B1 [Trypanosoma grayi]